MKANRSPSNKLQRERLARGWRQEEVAARLGVDVRSVRRWENGQAVRPYNISGLTQLFGKSAEELGLVEESTPEALEGLHLLPFAPPFASSAARISSEEALPARVMSAYVHFLPIAAVPLVGREGELAALKQLLRRNDVRLLTLTGTGGTGKTRLAVQAATELQSSFADGVFFIDLSPLRDSALVVSTIAHALGVQESGHQSLFENLKAYLLPRQSLLLLDNFEQVVDAAPLLAELLALCPSIKFLVTSREVMRLRAEYEFPVPPLELPHRSDPLNGFDHSTLLENAAVGLFVQRARMIQPGFRLSSENSAAIADICIYLDGLPLAIELVAAKSKMFAPRTLLTQLNSNFSQMSLSPLDESRAGIATRSLDFVAAERASRDLPARQQTIQNSIAWSYTLLSPAEQILFQRLAVFAGGCSLSAAQAICVLPGEPAISLVDVLASLVDKSMLLPLRQIDDEEPRISMLETIRAYGMQQLRESGKLAHIQQRHAAYYLALAEAANPALTGADEKHWLRLLTLDHQNIRVALHWSLASGGKMLEMTLRLSSALWPFWRGRGYLSEGRAFLEQVLAHSPDTIPPLLRARALNAAGNLASLQGDYIEAERLCNQGLRLFRGLANDPGIASSLNSLAQIATWKSDYAHAHTWGEEALTIYRALDDKPGIIVTLYALATASFNEGSYEQARAFAEESLQLARELGYLGGIARALWLIAVIVFSRGDIESSHALLVESHELSKEIEDKRGIADALVILAYTASFRGEYGRMGELLEEALALHRIIGDQRGIALGLYGQGWLSINRRDFVGAHRHFRESLTILAKLGHRWFTILCITGLAFTSSIRGELQQAARLWGLANALLGTIHSTLPPILATMYEQSVMKVREKLGEEAFGLAWSEGEGMTTTQVLEMVSVAR